MKKKATSSLTGIIICLLIFMPLLAAGVSNEKKVSLESILPKLDSWELSEKSETFLPEALFEYINGAAEIYLSYDFRELIVAQYKIKGGEANTSVEIYDMGTGENAFGIYGAERFPDNQYIPVGIQGYIEDDTLNFLVGSYYVKLLCFDGGERSSEYLRAFSGNIVSKVEDIGGFPPLVSVFPNTGLIANSEKYSLQNFLGYSFLGRGYLASYQVDDLEFDCFIINAENENSAKNMEKLFLDRKKDLPVKKMDFGYVVKDKYYKNIFLAVVKNYVCGVMKIKDGAEKTGIEYLNKIIQELQQR